MRKSILRLSAFALLCVMSICSWAQQPTGTRTFVFDGSLYQVLAEPDPDNDVEYGKVMLVKPTSSPTVGWEKAWAYETVGKVTSPRVTDGIGKFYYVTAIADGAFKNYEKEYTGSDPWGITFMIPASVEYIGKEAFVLRDVL